MPEFHNVVEFQLNMLEVYTQELHNPAYYTETFRVLEFQHNMLEVYTHELHNHAYYAGTFRVSIK